MTDHNDKEKPWVRIYDPWGDAEGSIAGNREGLAALKEKIDQALEDEEASMKGVDCDFESVTLRKTKEEKGSGGLKEKILGYGCLFIAILCIAVFFYGASQLWEAFFK